MENRKLIPAISVVILLAIATYLYRQNNPTTANPAPTAAVTTVLPQEGEEPTTSSTRLLGSPSVWLSPTQTQETNIKVSSPQSNDKVGRSFTVTGQARVFENNFQVRVTNSQTKEILFNQNDDTDAKDTGLFGNFTTQINLNQATLKSGDTLLLEVFQFSAKDGSEVDKVNVPLTFND